MAEIMEEDKVTIKEEISTVEDTCTVYVVGEDIKEEITENQGICKHFIYIYIKFFSFFLKFKPKKHYRKNLQYCLMYGKNTDFLRLSQNFRLWH